MSERLPNLNGLRAFEVVSRHDAVGAAARELNVTQTAVSHQLARLQAELGIDLLRRQGRGIALTEAGRTLAPHVRAAFDELRAGMAKLHQPGRRRPLTVSTLTSFAMKWLVPRLAGFQQRHPEIDVRLTTSLELVDFDHDDIDLAIRYGLGDWPALHVEKLIAEDIFPVCSPDLLAGVPPLRTPADLAAHTLLHVQSYQDDWALWLTGTGTRGVDAGSGLRFDLAATAIEAAIDGSGVALGRTGLVERDLAAGRLVIPFDVRLPTQAAYYLVTPAATLHRADPAAFRNWLLSEVAV